MNDWIERESKVYIQFFNRIPIVIESGKGCWVYDIEGRRYLDLVAGIACVVTGHSNEFIIERMKKQAEKLIHVSNLYYTKPQIELAEKLREITGLDRFFFTNSGTESVEAALKIARKCTGRKKFVSFVNDFHGRTMGALSVTWKEKFRKPFEPLVQPVAFADFNSIESLEKTVDEETAAVILELIQGESGVYPADREFVKRIFELKEKFDFLVIFDEVQTGFGRTGEWFAKDIYGFQPDIIAMAKAMGNGFPIGGVGITEEIHGRIDKGDHGSTFGGNPLACAVSLATIEFIEENNLVKNSKKMGDYFRKRLSELDFKNVRGYGLMIGVTVDDANTFVSHALKNGVLVNATSEKDIRIVPPLTIGKEEIDFAIEVFRKFDKR
uniref:Aspartate aminotransferase family protein n=1 Tax=Geoglobus ahangari TaxID=113653 RepID=A0A7C3UGW1_9EURY